MTRRWIWIPRDTYDEHIRTWIYLPQCLFSSHHEVSFPSFLWCQSYTTGSMACPNQSTTYLAKIISLITRLHHTTVCESLRLHFGAFAFEDLSDLWSGFSAWGPSPWEMWTKAWTSSSRQTTVQHQTTVQTLSCVVFASHKIYFTSGGFDLQETSVLFADIQEIKGGECKINASYSTCNST